MKSLSQLIIRKFSALFNPQAKEAFHEGNMPLESVDKDKTKRNLGDNQEQLIKDEQSPNHVVNNQDAGSDEKHQIPQKLLLALKHDNWVIRLKALHTVSHYPKELILPLIADATKDSDWEIRAVAIKYLAQLSEDSSYTSIFLDALSDTEFAVIDAATDVLKNYGEKDKTTVVGLIQKLKTERIDTLGSAIEILGYLGDDSATDHLKPFLTDTRSMWLDDRTLAQIAAESLVRIGSAQALNYVKESEGTGYIGDSPLTASDSQSDFAALAMDKASVSTSPSEKVALLLKALRSDNWKRSKKAARYLREYAKKLRKLGDEKVCSQLTEALTDKDWNIRWTVAEALAWLADKTAIPYLETALNDENWIVRVAAIHALVELKAQESLAKLAELLSDEHQTVRETCIEAISLLGGSKSVPYLERALKDDDAFVRLAAVRGVSNLEDDIAMTLLPQVLEDEYNHVRWFAIKRLVEIKDPSLAKYFASRLHDKDGPGWENLSIADYALQGLENIGITQSHETLGELKQDEADLGGDDES